MWKARERGVLFDLGHGGGSFWFRNAVPALREGFPPDSISTDLHMGSVNAAVLNTLHTASKCLAMGMPLQEVIYRTTVTPARAIRRPELGTLSEGAEADVAVLRLLPGPASYIDCGRARLDGRGAPGVRHDPARRADRLGPRRALHARVGGGAGPLLESTQPATLSPTRQSWPRKQIGVRSSLRCVAPAMGTRWLSDLPVIVYPSSVPGRCRPPAEETKI